MKYFIPMIILSLVLLSCGKKEETDDKNITITNTAQSITNSDFSITNYSTYDNSSSSESGVVYQLNSNSSFYDNEPSSSSSSSSCAFFDAFSTATLEEDGVNTYKLAINDMSIADCFGSSSGITITSSKGSVFMYGVVVVDSSGNVIDLTGKTFSYACSNCYLKSQAQAMYMSVSGTSSQGNIELISKQLISQSDGTACNVNSSTTFTSDCYQQSYNSLAAADSTIAIHKLIFKSGLDASSSGTYFTGGTITFQYNNWNGTMTYSSNSTSAAPTYSATNGTNSVSGTYNYSSSSSRSKRDNNLNTNLLDQQLINSFQNFVF